MIYQYAPLKRPQYHLEGMTSCEVSEIGRLEKAPAVWNLFWLSVPAIDAVPGTGLNWPKHYFPVEGAAIAVTADVLDDEVLYRKLLMHPRAFAEWFGREDLSIYDCSDLFGEQWRETVINRATAAAHRLQLMRDPVMHKTENVFYGNFGRRKTG